MSEELQLETQLARLETGDDEELAEAARALGLLGDPEAMPYLLPLVSHGLGKVPEPWSQTPSDMQPSSTAAFALAGAAAMLEQMEVRLASVRALGRLGDRRARDALLSARDSKQEHSSVRRLTRQLLTIWEIEDTEPAAHRSGYDDVASFLLFHFRDEFYIRGVESAREAVRDTPDYRVRWPRIAAIIRSRILRPGEPLKLIHDAANLPLDDNTDVGAYVWLDGMVRNVGNADREIEVY